MARADSRMTPPGARPLWQRWLRVMMILNLILGTIHPPIGVVLFVTSRIAGITFEKMSRAILPWLVPLLIVLAAVTLWPSLTLWLPNLVFGK